MKQFLFTTLLLLALVFGSRPVPVLAGTGIYAVSISELDYEAPDINDFFESLQQFMDTVGEFFSSFQDSIYILFPFIPENMVMFFITFASIFLGLEVYFLVRRLTI